MASLPPSNPSEPVVRRLCELLEQPQEPFLLEVYLLENGCSGRIMRSQASPFCCPLTAGKRLRKFGSHGDIRRSRAAGFLRLVLVKLNYSKTIRKALHWDRKTTANKRSRIFDFFSEELKDGLSPVSVLEQQHSDESSPFVNQIKDNCPLPSSTDSPRESSFTLKKETHEKSPCLKNAKFSNRRRLLFDCLREAEERIWSCHRCLDSEMCEEAMNELILSWERQKGDVNSLTQMVASEFSRFREEWNQFKPEVKEIGLCLEAAIFDDLKEEAILDILVLRCK